MKILRSGIAIAFGAIACGSSSAPPPEISDPQTDAAPYDAAGVVAGDPFPPSSTQTYTLKIGGVTGVAPGQQVGYALTSSAPKTYQLRWTGDARVAGDGFRQFYGAVWTTGHFTSVTPGCGNQVCPLESGDQVSGVQQVPGGERIQWETYASTGWDGLSFTTDTEPIYVDCWIDGARLPNLVFYPSAPDGAVANPAALPFGASSTP